MSGEVTAPEQSTEEWHREIEIRSKAIRERKVSERSRIEATRDRKAKEVREYKAKQEKALNEVLKREAEKKHARMVELRDIRRLARAARKKAGKEFAGIDDSGSSTPIEKAEELLGTINDVAKGSRSIDIRSLVVDINTKFESLGGLGKAAVDLYKNTKADAVKARLMVEFLKLNNNLSGEDDDSPENDEDIEAYARQVLEKDD